ncbi:transcriptional regulator with XRE-family HTH domain [Kitasatospora sp. MAP12-15]|uniref:helix-turn-helix domain-containing protein n=1 Tax=unclassified Kitasatospora TaxID=2633591 RepID=UPI0024733790|nr:helix-turn-helix transcriptional regulator [Kitasatospora sp. MAP12-44]MDH6113921.1 transcriptional regulator with XRE-family HTH domain [Kitasatospora sp. MAP12-44]
MNRKELDPQSSPRAAFGSQLRSSREARGWSQAELAERIKCSASYVSAVETGRKSTSLKFAKSADAALGTGQTLELMWIGARRRGFIEGFPEHAAQETRAVEIRIFEPNRIPGLLQTLDYAAAIEAAGVARAGATQEQADERLKFLTTRQRLLKREMPPLIHAVIAENCLRQPIGGAKTMGAQLDHLVALAARPQVIIQVAPFRMAELVPFTAVMTLLTFADRSVVGYAESADEGHVVRREKTISAWERAYHQLQVEALTQAASLTLISKAREELQS